MSEVKRWTVNGFSDPILLEQVGADNPIEVADTTEFVLASDYNRLELAYQLMDDWFSDSMTQEQVDTIEEILGEERT